MPRAVRCPSCNRVVAVQLGWAIRDICPHCLHPLSAAGSGEESSRDRGTAPAVEVVSAWIDCFNDRDLDGMLWRMSESVDFHPLRLGDVQREYQGHDGVRRWFADLGEMSDVLRIELAEIRCGRDDQIVSVGEVVIGSGVHPAPFWALSRVVDGRIVTAYHYLTDPDVMDHLDPRGV